MIQNFVQKIYKSAKRCKTRKKPLNKICLLEELNFFEITIPKKNDPMIETIKLLFINALKKVAT